MIQKVLKVGSSVAVTIPKKSLKSLGIKAGDEVEVSVNTAKRVVTIEAARGTRGELLAWTDAFIKQYRPALKALAKK